MTLPSSFTDRRISPYFFTAIAPNCAQMSAVALAENFNFIVGGESEILRPSVPSASTLISCDPEPPTSFAYSANGLISPGTFAIQIASKRPYNDSFELEWSLEYASQVNMDDRRGSDFLRLGGFGIASYVQDAITPCTWSYPHATRTLSRVRSSSSRISLKDLEILRKMGVCVKLDTG